MLRLCSIFQAIIAQYHTFIERGHKAYPILPKTENLETFWEMGKVGKLTELNAAEL